MLFVLSCSRYQGWGSLHPNNMTVTGENVIPPKNGKVIFWSEAGEIDVGSQSTLY